MNDGFAAFPRLNACTKRRANSMPSAEAFGGQQCATVHQLELELVRYVVELAAYACSIGWWLN